MGGCLSTTGARTSLIEKTDGGADEFHSRFIEDDVLGEGEFGCVRKVFDLRLKGDRIPFACKYLKKGMTFKDNTLYTAIKPEILRGEVEILRALAGQEYCLKLHALYESPKLIYVITEMCQGGEMMEWVSKQTEDLRTEDVSRIAYQMLSSIAHCAEHNIIHRDIKGENIMFETSDRNADIRLIDFGSGTNRPPSSPHPDHPDHHTTFAGSAFYISPEMFQHTYTTKTDVWSVGVTLYVLVAGYPADCLQKAFNVLQTSKGRNLRDLPNLPPNMPDSYYEMLDQCLTYRHKKRRAAKDIVPQEFVQFHLQTPEQLDADGVEEEKEDGLDLADIVATAHNPKSPLTKTTSVLFSGSVKRHTVFLDYQKYERSLTTLLATILTKNELEQLVRILNERYNRKKLKLEETKGEGEIEIVAAPTTTPTAVSIEEEEAPAISTVKTASLDGSGHSSSNDNNIGENTNSPTSSTTASATTSPKEGDKLGIVPINILKDILEKEIQNPQVIPMIDSLKNSESYTTFAYHIVLLKEFAKASSSSKKKKSSGTRQRRRVSGSESSDSSHSGGGSLRLSLSGRVLRRQNSGTNSSIDGSTGSGGSQISSKSDGGVFSRKRNLKGFRRMKSTAGPSHVMDDLLGSGNNRTLQKAESVL